MIYMINILIIASLPLEYLSFDLFSPSVHAVTENKENC